MNTKDQAGRAKVVTPSDTVNIAPPFGSESKNKGCLLRIGDISGGTDIKVLTVGGDEITYNGIYAGEWIPVNVVRVYATGTTVSNIVAHW